MTTGVAQQRSLPVGWPLGISVLATALVAGFVCSPPTHRMQTWGQIVTLATAYVLLAAAVHAVAVWSVCRVREESESADWRLVLSVIWAAWIVVVWLPLIALLTSERSPWVALILPVTAVFSILLLRWRAASTMPPENLVLAAGAASPLFSRGFFAPEAQRELWRDLLPAAGAALALELGLALLAAGHNWSSGCLLGAASVYPLTHWPARHGDAAASRRASHTAATANSAVVWLLLVLALLPFAASFGARTLAGLFHMNTHARPSGAPQIGALGTSSRGWVGLILVPPHIPHPIVAPTIAGASDLPGKNQVIPFDGAYWYYKTLGEGPGPAPHISRGDPAKNRILSTDQLPLIMEAHQKFVRPLDISGSRSLRIDVTNADTVAGPIAVEIILHEAPRTRPAGSAKGPRPPALHDPSAAALGERYLATSLVSPMPLKRAPVADSLSFPLPSYLHGRTIDGITVRIHPGRGRALAGPQVAIKDFALER